MSMPTKAEREAALREFYAQRVDSLDTLTRADLRYALMLMHSVPYEGTDDERAFLRDLEKVSAAQTRTEFLRIGDIVRAKWDRILSSADCTPEWNNPYCEFVRALEWEHRNQEDYLKFSATESFCDPVDLLEAHAPEALEELDGDELDTLRHALDFESIGLRFDGLNVASVDTISGVILSIDPLDEFVRESIEYAKG